MRQSGGYLVGCADGYTRDEADTFTCCHCNRIVIVRPKQTVVGWCSMCFKPQCPKCEAKGVCTPFEKKLEAVERRRMLCEML